MKNEMGPVSTLKSQILCALLSGDSPPPHTHRVSACLSFPILCQIVSVRLVKSAKLEQQSPNLKQDKSNKIKMSDENMWH